MEMMMTFKVEGCLFKNPSEKKEEYLEAPDAVTAMKEFQKKNYGWIAVEATACPLKEEWKYWNEVPRNGSQLPQGCWYDSKSQEFRVYQTKPKTFPEGILPLVTRHGLCPGTIRIEEFTNRKGTKMISLSGRCNWNEKELKTFLLKMRKDLTTWIKKKSQ